MTELSKRFSLEKLMTLSKLDLSQEEENFDTPYLKDIIALAEKISEIDTDHVPPATHAFDVVQPLRADKVTEGNRREDYQEIAPQVAEGLYLVPPVIE
jgi:aspartyl-tRNA(Asn)/glutamyl-tRNA(Gln) amidotransferase subunit C